MSPDRLAASQRLVEELHRSPRRRIPLVMIRDAFARVCPEYAEEADGRRYLNELIRTAVEQGAFRLPRKAIARDRPNEDGLPLFIVLNRPSRSARTTVGRGYAWHPMLSFAVNEKSARRVDCLRSINEWLKCGPNLGLMVPIKERSLEIFKDEKKLDRLRAGRQDLFRGRLTLASIGCRICPMPLPYELGPASALGRPILVLENHDTWSSFCAWNRVAAQYSCIAYAGGGHRKGLSYDEGFLDELLARTQSDELSYFGDLDPAGLSIAAGISRLRADRKAMPLTPAARLYSWLIERGVRRPLRSRQQADLSDMQWLPDVLRSAVAELFAAGLRIPQESLGTIALMEQRPR